MSDLTPLSGLTALTSLDCSGYGVSDLTPLSGLTALTSLRCSRIGVSDLTPLSGLTSLISLDCSETEVSDLTPLSGLTALTSLNCSRTGVNDLTPLSGLTALTSLNCSRTGVSDLTPLSGLTALISLNCSRTGVSNLTLLTKGFEVLEKLSVFGCPISTFKETHISPALSELYLGGSRIHLPDILSDELSSHEEDNCLHGLRNYFADRAEGEAPFDDVKLVLLGNGRIGKTQIARRLCGDAFDPEVPSTHAFEVRRAAHPMREGVEAQLNIWDFGGQDIYHGTHSIFLKTRAIFVIVWTPGSETGSSTDAYGTTSQNEPLSYWMDYVEQLAGPESPIIVLQNQCDIYDPVTKKQLPGIEHYRHVLKQDSRTAKVIATSAKDQEGWKKFHQAISDCVQVVWDREHPMIGKSRIEFLNELHEMREADQAIARKLDRKHRKIAWGDYEAMIEKHGVTGGEGFAQTLDRAGMVYWRKNLFDGDLVLDRSWCLDAIYSVLDRGKVVKRARAQNGLLTCADLGKWVWNEQGFNRKEQEEFLKMMVACHLAFKVSGNYSYHKNHYETSRYIIPELLPPRSEVLAAKVWGLIPERAETVRFAYDFLPPQAAQAVLSELGQYAQQNASYWRYGMCFWGARETAVLVEEELDTRSGSRKGSILLHTKGPDSRDVRSHLASLIKHVLTRDSNAPQPKISETAKWDKIDFAKEENKDTRAFGAKPLRYETNWSHQRIAHAMQPTGWQRLYVLGSLDRRITFYSQQARALRLVHALATLNQIEGKRVAVIGAGVAGVTAAEAAQLAGAKKVTLYEERHQMLQLQGRASHRYIHPHIYDWPSEHSKNKNADLPLLNWKAAYADKVVKKIAGQITLKKKRIKLGKTIEKLKETGDQIELYAKDCFCADRFDVAIVASGFGIETEHWAETCPSYWRPDNLEGPFDADNPERILVGGSGDGGLIDAVRAAMHTGKDALGPYTFEHHEAIKLLENVDAGGALGKALLEVDDRFRMAAQTDGAEYDLRYHYHLAFRKLPNCDEIVETIKAQKRTDTKVWFNYRDVNRVFTLESSLLNRALVLLLIEAGIIHPLRGTVDQVENEHGLYAVRMKGRSEFEPQRFDRLLLRFGQSSGYIATRYPELADAVQDLRYKGQIFPVTKLSKETRRFWEDMVGK